MRMENSDKIGHLLAYFTLCFSWLYAFKNNTFLGIKKHTIITLVILYGIIIEVLQGVLTTYRQADIYDVLANTTGVFLAVFLFQKVSRFL